MALLFDLYTLEQSTQCDPQKLVTTLELWFNKKIFPKNRYSKVKPLLNLSGNNYLLNPAPLFSDKTTDVAYKAQYIRLAGRRDYFQYKYYKTKHLDLSYYTDINLDAIKTNPLLTITDNKIHFKYEEI